MAGPDYFQEASEILRRLVLQMRADTVPAHQQARMNASDVDAAVAGGAAAYLLADLCHNMPAALAMAPEWGYDEAGRAALNWIGICLDVGHPGVPEWLRSQAANWPEEVRRGQYRVDAFRSRSAVHRGPTVVGK